MATQPSLDHQFDPAHGQPVGVAPGVVRLTADNRSAFTFTGTNTYLVGDRSLAVIDPGPADDAHLKALTAAIDDRPVSHVVVTHTHVDHSALAPKLAAATGAKIVGAAAHHGARALHMGEANPLEAAIDSAHRPDLALADGDILEGEGWSLETVSTPGHTANHLCFALAGTGIVFTGDHIMGWSTSIVAPPDGSMADYMASLDTMLMRKDRLILPGHGQPIDNPAAFVRGLKNHRKMRERAILDRLREGDRTIAALVTAIYRDIDPRLHGAAALSVLAHLEDLVARGFVETNGPAAVDGRYVPVSDTAWSA